MSNPEFEIACLLGVLVAIGVIIKHGNNLAQEYPDAKTWSIAIAGVIIGVIGMLAKDYALVYLILIGSSIAFFGMTLFLASMYFKKEEPEYEELPPQDPQDKINEILKRNKE